MKSNQLYTILLAVFFSVLLNFSASAQDFAQSSVSTESKTANSIKLKITGINCSGDIKDIQKQISELPGVTNCEPAKKPAATTVFQVTYNPALVTEKQIRAAVESTAGCSDPESRPYKVKG